MTRGGNMSEITAELTSGLEVTMSNGRHTWRAGEPESAGGTDGGPNPYELLLGSLAACTCMTIAMYCRHKNLDLQSVKASFEFSNVHADDCDDCDDETSGFIEQVSSHVNIAGEFDESQQRRLAQIATRCPVHKTLTQGLHITDKATFNKSESV